MQQDQLPGLNVHINEGRVTGTFELPPADMQQIKYQGRVVLVLVADATAITVKDTKDGDTKASWTFKGVDAAIVRDQGMRDHLANALYLDGIETPPIGTIPVKLPTKVGLYDNEGAFLGFEDRKLAEVTPFEEELEALSEKVAPKEEEEEDDLQEFGESKVGQPAEEEIFRIESHQPIKNKDPLLERFLNADVSSGV